MQYANSGFSRRRRIVLGCGIIAIALHALVLFCWDSHPRAVEIQDVAEGSVEVELFEGSPAAESAATDEPAEPIEEIPQPEPEPSPQEAPSEMPILPAPEPPPEPMATPQPSPKPAPRKVVQASTANGDASSATVALASATSPSVPLATTSWKLGVGQAIELLEKQIKETPSNDESLLLSQEMTLRMLYVSQRRLDDALRPIPLLNGNESEQQFVHHQMLALYEASNPDAMPVRSRHWSIVMNSQREATNHLAAASNLEVKSLAFCTEVERYGVVTKFPKTQIRLCPQLPTLSSSILEHQTLPEKSILNRSPA
jgi:hypothetical protein